MKTRNYMCENCEYEREEYFQDTEEAPDRIEGEACPLCGGVLVCGLTLKNNPQRWRHRDSA